MSKDNPCKPLGPDNDPQSGAATESKVRESEAANRDAKGRFLTGNNGGGRKKGSRNRLTETFLAAIESDFADHGADALERLRANEPAAYLRLIASLVPRDLILKREQEPDYSDLSDDELAKVMWRAWRSSQIRKQLQGVKS